MAAGWLPRGVLVPFAPNYSFHLLATKPLNVLVTVNYLQLKNSEPLLPRWSLECLQQCSFKETFSFPTLLTPSKYFLLGET